MIGNKGARSKKERKELQRGAKPLKLQHLWQHDRQAQKHIGAADEVAEKAMGQLRSLSKRKAGGKSSL